MQNEIHIDTVGWVVIPKAIHDEWGFTPDVPSLDISAHIDRIRDERDYRGITPLSHSL